MAQSSLVLILKGIKKKVPNLVQGSLAPMGEKLSSAEFIESPFKVLTKRLMKKSETPENFCI